MANLKDSITNIIAYIKDNVTPGQKTEDNEVFLIAEEDGHENYVVCDPSTPDSIPVYVLRRLEANCLAFHFQFSFADSGKYNLLTQKPFKMSDEDVMAIESMDSQFMEAMLKEIVKSVETAEQFKVVLNKYYQQSLLTAEQPDE